MNIKKLFQRLFGKKNPQPERESYGEIKTQLRSGSLPNKKWVSSASNKSKVD